jgi:periplasmic protein TonB
MTMLKSKQLFFTTLLTLTLSIVFGQQAPIDSTVYPSEIVTIKPVFKGGEKAMYTTIAQNLKFPPELRQKVGMHGTAIVSFNVDEQGKLDAQSIKMLYFQVGTMEKNVPPIRIFRESKLNNLQAICVAEAKRVILSLPNWTPAQVDGKAVKCRHNLPISFKNEGFTFRK